MSYSSTAAVSHDYNSTLEIFYSEVGNDRHLFNYMDDHYHTDLLPNYQHIARAMKKDRNDSKSPYGAIFVDICEQLKGYHSLFSIYSNHLQHLPSTMIGPHIVAYEMFLEEFERAISPYITPTSDDYNRDNSFTPSIFEPQLYTSSEKTRELTIWPHDKFIILHSENTGHSSTYLYRDYIRVLSDALNRLGVAHRLSSVGPQQFDVSSDSVTLYVKDRVEEDDPLRSAAISGPGGSGHRYVQWHLEHPVDDQCTLKGHCSGDYDSADRVCGEFNPRNGE